MSSVSVHFSYNFFMGTVTKFQSRFNECLYYSAIKQTDLAKAVGVSKQCISDYKSGKSLPSLETLYLLCRYLDVSADYLLGLKD